MPVGTISLSAAQKPTKRSDLQLGTQQTATPKLGANLSIPLKQCVFTGKEKVTKGTNTDCADTMDA